MEQLNHNYSPQVDSRRDGVLESASKRVRMIFSVMASPNRIDILRILNSKGPLTYSELKSFAGFKSKKESGKFAYHLRKLLRQSLVALNKAERRYTITNLGKLVLSLARQIEERSIVESGKMYVRTTKHSFEEFNSNKIIQSLVREANMPLEQAHKITEEVENKIYKLQTVYLTSSLIRETVNSVLIEHGYEEYRNKLARLGMPTADIIEMLNSVDTARNGIDSITAKASQSMFSEHLIINSLPKDIADMHLAGEISISNSGVWGLIPDTVFLNIADFAKNGLDLKGKFLNVSRLPPIKNSDDFMTMLPLLISLLSREASTEIVLDGLLPQLLLTGMTEPTEIASLFAKALIASTVSPSYLSPGLPITTMILSANHFDARVISSVLDGYRKYVDITPIPRIGLALNFDRNDSNLMNHLESITQIIRTGGIVSISHGESRSSYGIRKTIGNTGSAAIATLQSLSVNLPRLAYQSNKDETYFRARLALVIKPALAAISLRKKVITDLIRKGIIPTISNGAKFVERGVTNMVINLTGLRESVYNILGHDVTNDGFEIIQKVLKTAVNVTSEHSKLLGEDSVGIAMLHDDSGKRFSTLDSDKYGKTSLFTSQNIPAYSQGLLLNSKELLSRDKRYDHLTQECISIDSLLNGGLSVTLDVNDISSKVELNDVINLASELPFFRPRLELKVCNTCGKRSTVPSLTKCEFCQSPYLLPILS